MASAVVQQAKAKIEALENSQQQSAYQNLLSELKRGSPSLTSDLIAIVDSFFSQGLSVVATRELLNKLISVTNQIVSDSNAQLEVAQATLARLTSAAGTSSSFPDQMTALLELSASGHEAADNFSAAADCLAKIPVDATTRRADNLERARVWIRIVRNYLEDDASENAEPYLNKLKNVMHTVQDPVLTLHFHLSQARINDAKREFLAAAGRYQDISLSTAIAEEERLHTLAMAIKCAILAPAGPSRSRMLGRLYNDERAAQLPEFAILEKIFFERLLDPEEVDKFAEGLQRHQLATTADGSTVLARAVVEHNLQAASRLYANIGFSELGALLGLSDDKAEETTAKMIEQGRLLGRMDQIEHRIWFESGDASGEGGSNRTDVMFGKEMRRWALNTQGVADEVESIVNALQKLDPQMVAEIIHS